MIRILIIEDNQTNMELMVYLLTAFGYSVESAKSGQQGLEKALQQTPDVIVCDLEMPGMDGFAVVRQLKNHAYLKDVPVIAVSSQRSYWLQNTALKTCSPDSVPSAGH